MPGLFETKAINPIPHIFQPVFFNRGSAEPQGSGSGFQGFRRNIETNNDAIFLLTCFITKSRIDTWIIAKVSMSNANICGTFRCSERFKNIDLNWPLHRRKVKNWNQMPTWHFIYFQRGIFAYLQVKLFHWIRMKWMINGQWFIVSYDSANKQKHHKSHRMQ